MLNIYVNIVFRIQICCQKSPNKAKMLKVSFHLKKSNRAMLVRVPINGIRSISLNMTPFSNKGLNACGQNATASVTIIPNAMVAIIE